DEPALRDSGEAGVEDRLDPNVHRDFGDRAVVRLKDEHPGFRQVDRSVRVVLAPDVLSALDQPQRAERPAQPQFSLPHTYGVPAVFSRLEGASPWPVTEN